MSTENVLWTANANNHTNHQSIQQLQLNSPSTTAPFLIQSSSPSAAATSTKKNSVLVFDYEEFLYEFFDNLLFLVASCLYLIISIQDLEWEEQIQGIIPVEELEAGDDAVWSRYGIDDDDDYVFKIKLKHHFKIHVSKYMIMCFVAALCFVVVGILEYLQYKKTFTGIFFILAGLFGVLSSIFTEDNEDFSDNLDLISSVMFSLEALQLFVDTPPTTFRCWLLLANTCFVLGAVMDVMTSLIEKLAPYSLPLSYASVLDSFLWVVCALIYSSIMFLEVWNGDYHYDPDDYSEEAAADPNPEKDRFMVDSEHDTEASSMSAASRFNYGSIVEVGGEFALDQHCFL
jgi:hypothetical protein